MLTINNSATDIYAGILGGTGTNYNDLSLAKTGLGTLTLSGNNTYIGWHDVLNGNGTVTVASVNALGTSGNLVFTGGTLQFSSANTVDFFLAHRE